MRYMIPSEGNNSSTLTFGFSGEWVVIDLNTTTCYDSVCDVVYHKTLAMLSKVRFAYVRFINKESAIDTSIWLNDKVASMLILPPGEYDLELTSINKHELGAL